MTLQIHATKPEGAVKSRPRISPPRRAGRLEHPSAGTRSGWPMRLTYFVSDFASILVALVIAHLLSHLVRGVGLAARDILQIKLDLVLVAGLLAVAMFQRTYAAIPPRPVRQFRGWVLGSLWFCATLIAALWLLGVGSWMHYLPLCLGTGMAIVFASFNRAMCRVRFGKAAWWGSRVIVVGDGDSAAQLFTQLDREPQWGLRAAGLFDDPQLFDGLDPAALDEPLERLDQLARSLKVDRALVTIPSFAFHDLTTLLSRAGGQIRHWIILPPIDRFPSMWQEECEAARRPALAVTNRLALPSAFLAKRAFDLVLTFAGMPLIVPFVVVGAILVRLTSRGSIFYGQERIGRNGRRFKAWKLRTMYPDADAILGRWLEEHPDLAEEWAANHKLKRDPRITPVGRWLRALSIDELPQIWNVLTGEMSLVGPRPIVAAEIDKYADRFEDYLRVMPGITGLWQVSGRNNTTYAERVDLDAYYVQNWSLWLDLYIIACTVKVVLLGHGAY